MAAIRVQARVLTLIHPNGELSAHQQSNFDCDTAPALVQVAIFNERSQPTDEGSRASIWLSAKQSVARRTAACRHGGPAAATEAGQAASGASVRDIRPAADGHDRHRYGQRLLRSGRQLRPKRNRRKAEPQAGQTLESSAAATSPRACSGAVAQLGNASRPAGGVAKP